MSSLAETVSNDIIEALKQDRLTLPTLPEVAMRVRAIAENEESTINDLTVTIAQDTALSARIIRVVNSPLLRAAQEVTDLPMAISRLGMSYTSNLAIGLAMEQMFQATSEIIEDRMQSLWHLTVQLSSWCSAIAAHTGVLPQDEALLAGLIHRIGALPILSYAEEHDDVIHDSLTLSKVIDRLHGALGSAILENWGFADRLAEVPKLYRKLERQTQTADYAAIVTLANLIHGQHEQSVWREQSWAEVPLFGLFSLPADPADELYQQLSEKVASSHAALA